jgi:hypothetical protein
MAILIVDTGNGSGVGFYDIGDLDPRPIEKLLPKLGRFKVSGHVVAGTWFGIEPHSLGDLFHMGDLPESDKIDPFLEAPKELRLAILESWTRTVRSLPDGSASKKRNQASLDKISVLMRTGKPDRFTLIDDW